MRRPHIHFTPQRGWMNDPNGTIYIDGMYHMFYQHYPKDISWGPMHWGHATSRDLIHWNHEPIALFPDEQGYIFSGSCILDVKNVTGLSHGTKPVLLAYYTLHHPDTGLEEQCMAYSEDYSHFTKYEKNPVIANPDSVGKKDFRDPKVYVNDKGDYSMVLACGDHLEFFFSENLLDWTWCSSFYPSKYGFAGLCECPDCFPIQMEDKTRYVLMMSMVLDEDHVTADYDLSWKEFNSKHVMQYFVGQFDGRSFTDTQVLSEPMVLDYGPDAYAGATFNLYHKSPQQQIMIAWAEDWENTSDCPTISGICKGKMSMARYMTLRYTDAGIRLACKPVLSGEYRIPKTLSMNSSEGFNPMLPAIYQANFETNGEIRICNGADEEVLIEITEDELHIDCRYAAAPQFGMIKENPTRDFLTARRVLHGSCDVTLIYDEGVLEVYADEGTLVFTVNVYPNIPYTQIVCIEK